MSTSPTSENPGNRTPEEWASEYERIRHDYDRFTRKLETLLADLLAARGIPYHLIEARTKDLKSFREKIGRATKGYANPLAELTDLSGIRVITYYQDDADLFASVIESEFEVDERNSVEHSPSGAEFGYKSAHYVVRLSAARAQLLEWHGLAGLKAEIQVRTVLQHAWAAISHKLQYKREEDVPSQLRRKLFRLSALFELADDEFVSLREASGTLSRTIGEQLASGERNVPIDYVSLSKFIDTSPLVAELCAAAAEVGFDFNHVDGPDDSDEDSLSDLIQLAAITRLSSIGQFESALEQSAKWAKDYLSKQYIQSGSSKRNRWHVSPAFVCELLLVRTQISHLRPGHLLRLGWDRGIAARVFQIAQEFGNSAA